MHTNEKWALIFKMTHESFIRFEIFNILTNDYVYGVILTIFTHLFHCKNMQEIEILWWPFDLTCTANPTVPAAFFACFGLSSKRGVYQFWYKIQNGQMKSKNICNGHLDCILYFFLRSPLCSNRFYPHFLEPFYITLIHNWSKIDNFIQKSYERNQTKLFCVFACFS